jgi:hypothetical protein
MARGVMKWFDPGRGEGEIVASGRQYPVVEGEVERPARAAGARVVFDIRRIDGVATAVRVRGRPGTRSTARQRRFGDLTGAGRPEEKGRRGLTRQQTDLDSKLSGRPAELVRRWVAAADSGHLEAMLPLYAPEAVLHTSAGDRHGRGAVRAFLLDSGLLTRGWNPVPRGADDGITAVRGPLAADAGRSTRFRIAHGHIVEQWIQESG